MNIKTVLVEDEHHSMQRMKTLLAEFDQIEIIGEAEDGQSAIELIDSLKPDLTFLDIQLPEFTSFEVLSRLSHRPMVIFVTAYDQYAIHAFEENAVDYLLKPTNSERLGRAIDKVIRHQRPVNASMLAILKQAVQHPEYAERFTVRTGDEILLIPAERVTWFKAEDKYVFLNTYNQSYILDTSLKKLESMLDPNVFCRIHKSVIIAQPKIARIKRSLSGKYGVIMEDAESTRFEIGRTYVQDVRKRLAF